MKVQLIFSHIQRWFLCFCTVQSLFVVLAAGFLVSCVEDSDPDFEKETFTSIYDHDEFSSTFYPIDVAQTPDGGYLILAEQKIVESNFRGVYLLRADEFGDFVKELRLEEQYVNPVGRLMDIGGEYYFFAMDALSLQAQLVKVDAQAEAASVVPVGGITYPSAGSLDGTNFLLLSYNHTDKNSVVSIHNATGDFIREPKQFSIGAGDDVEEPIMNHFIHTGRKFPFQVGRTSGLYFFNGFENYTFSLVFTDMMKEGPIGVVQGQQDDGGFSAVLPLSNDRFAASRFNFGDNYFLPGIDLPTNGPAVGSYLGGLMLPELIPNAPVKILHATIGSTSTLIYASDTRSKQIGLFFYKEDTGEFISSRYLGFSNPFEIAALIRTADDGLAVCGTTWLAGRFPRICLFKISKEELSRQVE